MINDINKLNQENLRNEMELINKRIGISKVEESYLFPRYFQLENTRNCNARCPFCAIDDWDKSVMNISDKLFDKIAEEMSDYSNWIINVAIQRAGEPLLDAKISNKIRKLKNIGIKSVNMSTNASPLTEKKSYELLDSGLDELIISFDSLDKDEYESTRVGLKYDKVLKNVVKFLEIRNKSNTHCKVRIRGVAPENTDTEEFKEKLSKWESYWKKYTNNNDRIYMKKLHNWGNQVLLNGQEIKTSDVYHPCIMPWSTMHITTSGKVALCGQDFDAKVLLGDINYNTIAEVWNSERQNWVREMHSGGNRNNLSMCQGCKLWDLDFTLEKGKKDLIEQITGGD